MSNHLAPELLDAALNLQSIADAHGIPVLLVGAFARDILLQGASGQIALRKTKDVDFAVMVKSWDEFELLRTKLFASGKFTPSKNAMHKVYFQGMSEVDLVPFGDLVEADGVLRCWPGDFGMVMNLLGFREAFESSVVADLGPVKVRTLTVESFVVLKLISWNDKKERIKDAVDLALLTKEHVTIPGRIDLLWMPENVDLVEQLDRYEIQVARLLGRCIGRQDMAPETRALVLGILERETSEKNNELALAMGALLSYVDAKEALGCLLAGMRDVQFSEN